MTARSGDSANRASHRRRKAVAVVVSTVLHVLFLGFIVTRAPPTPPEPEIVVQPLDVTIMPMPPIPEKLPILVPPKITPLKIEPQPTPQTIPVPTPPKPEPQKPQPAKPEPPQPKPSPPKPTPPKPAPVIADAILAPMKSATPKPVTPKLSPLKSPSLSTATPTLAPPAPQESPKPPSPTPQVSASPAPTASLNKLNLHKPEKKAPADVPTLPVAGGSPAGGATAAAAAALNGAAFEAPGSRLSGLNPYPYGVMPSGGSGLRGTLVGCANASAVGLSSVERAHCNERFGVRADRAPALDGINPSKRAGFDRDAERQERNRGSRGVDPMSAMRGGQAPSPSEPDIKNSPTSFQH